MTTPFNQILWPEVGLPGLPAVWNASTAMAIPGVGRAAGLYSGMIKQMPLDDMRGIEVLPRPRLLEQPDPARSRSWWIGLQVEDYLLHGNALCVITARDAYGWPAAVTWLPAEWTSILWEQSSPTTTRYYVHGHEIPAGNVIHVRRGADRSCPSRGVGVVEQYLASLDRIANQETYERNSFRESSMPSVAVISPNPQVSQEEADAAQEAWIEKYGGPTRKPGVFPSGTQVIPLSWSPEDAQLTEARKLALTDVGNMFGLDSYWLGAPVDSLTYRSPGPMYLNLLRVSLEPVLTDLEDAWSAALLPRGRRVRFDRNVLLRDDLQTTVETMTSAVSAGLMTLDEARAWMQLPPLPTAPAPTPDPAPGPDPEPEPVGDPA